MSLKRLFSSALAVAVIGMQVPVLRAEDGVTDKEIRIGSCAALTGPAQDLGAETVRGAKAYLDYVNAKGGVGGRKIVLSSKDDGYDPEKAIGCFKSQMNDKVFALGFFVGTPTAVKYSPMAMNAKIPIVGLFTGAEVLRNPVKRYVINVRASYFNETEDQVANLWDGAGAHKIAVLYQDDAFGAAVLAGVKAALAKRKAEPAALGSFPRNTVDVDAGIAQVKAANPDAVILVGAYGPLAEIVKRAKASGWSPRFLTVSFVGTTPFIKAAGDAADGVVITQVVPPPSRADLPTVALYRKLIVKAGGTPDFTSLEGFVDAMVLVEGLKRAGKDLSREKLIDSLETIKSFDMGLGGQLKADFSPDDHQAFNRVYDTVVRKGEAVVFTDWKTLNK
jgi:ABC-type branched-subunit amino acid transport system substrate-binding protein